MKAVFPVALVGVLLLAVADGSPTSRGAKDSPSVPEERSESDRSVSDTAEGSGRTAGQSDRLEDAKANENDKHEGRADDGAQPIGSTEDVNSLFVVGNLTNTGRLLAVRGSDIVRLARDPAETDFPIVGMSPIVGYALTVADAGRFFVLSASNHAQLVRLDKNLGGLKTLSLRDELTATGELWYGSIVPVERDRVLVSVATGSKTAVVDIDVSRWAVRRTAVFDDRFSNFPNLCRAGDRLFLSSFQTVDVLSMDLDRIASASVGSRDLGLACTATSGWVSGAEAPELLEVTAEGRLGRKLTWKGKGAAPIIFDPASQTFFGSDQDLGRVFACHLRGPCRTSPELGPKPTDLLVLGDYLFVAAEGSKAIAVVRLENLEVIGSVPFPGRPRAFVPLVTSS